MKLRVWWIPQVPMKTFYVPVNSVEEAAIVTGVLAEYDDFQFQNNVKPDYCNAGGLQYYDEADQEWLDWYDESDNTFDEHCRIRGLKAWSEIKLANKD